MKKIIIILLGVIVYCACQDDDKHSWDTAGNQFF